MNKYIRTLGNLLTAKKGVRKGCAEDVSGSDEVKSEVYNSNSSALTLFLFFSPVNLLTARVETQESCRLGKFLVQNARISLIIICACPSVQADICGHINKQLL
jgi:hypothetical protein